MAESGGGRAATGNVVRDKSYQFALAIISLYRNLTDQREFILAKQLLNSGTSIGANIEEAMAGQSRADFVAKMSIASKEARESAYWLRLLRDSNTGDQLQVEQLLSDAEELISIITSIVKTTARTAAKNRQ